MRLFVILALLCALGLSFSSVVNFTTPTNGTIFSNATSYVFNATATQLEASPMSVLNWSWNGSSYVFYNGSLFAMYDFDNVSSIGENDSLVVDSSLNSNNVSCSGSNCPSWSSSGRYGGAFTFDGIDDYFNGSRSTSLETQALSVESWIYIDSSPGIRSAIATYGYGTTAGGPIDGSAESYSLSYQNDISSFRFRLKDAAGTNFIDLYSSSSTPLAEIQNRWVHVAATWDGTNAKIYKNGQLHLSSSNAGTINYFADPGSKLRIGNWFGNNERWFKGKIDSLRIYGRSFNSSEILQHYYSDLSKFNATSWIFYSNQSTSDEGQNTYGLCMLDSSNDLNCTLTRNLTIDRTAPSVSLISPSNRSEVSRSSPTASFTFNATDSLSSNVSCSLIFDGLNVGSNSSVSNSSIAEFIHAVDSSSSLWNVSCSDLAGNTGVSSTYSIGFIPTSSASSSSSIVSNKIRSSFDSSCNQNALTTNPPEVSVEITDDSTGELIFEGSSGSSGEINFDGCGKTIRYSLSKSGYRSSRGVEVLGPCTCLGERSEPTQENSPVSSSSIPIDTSESNSALVPPSSSTPNPSLFAPFSASVGESIIIRSEFCLGCTLVVEDPSGIVLRVELGDSQMTNISITQVGNYQFSLLKEGETIARSSLVSSSIPSLAVPASPTESIQNPPQKVSTNQNSNSWVVPFILVLIVVIGSALYLFVFKKKK